MKPAILVGNDINNINNNLSWSDLLIEVVRDLGVSIDLNNMQSKPFPLLYEEIYLTAIKQKKIVERNLKEAIRDRVDDIQFNSIHERITQSKLFEHILTTNYEYSLEYAFGANDSDYKNLGLVNERRYSIFRNHRINDLTFWHIHGEVDHPGSILLGYEQYSGQLQAMRNYVATGISYRKKEAKLLPLLHRMGKRGYQMHSWVDLFFLTDVHIVGLSLDFAESDLWWLLNYRARMKFGHGRTQKQYPELVRKLKRSKIFYYFPEEFRESSSGKLELMAANGVETIGISREKKALYYGAVLDRIASMYS